MSPWQLTPSVASAKARLSLKKRRASALALIIDQAPEPTLTKTEAELLRPLRGARSTSKRCARAPADPYAGVIAVDDRAITMVTRTSARLRIYRGEPDEGAVLAWEL